MNIHTETSQIGFLTPHDQVVNNAASFGADLSKGLIIGGDSAGAGLTAVIAHRARDDPFFQRRQPSGQILQIPCVIDPRAYPEQ